MQTVQVPKEKFERLQKENIQLQQEVKALRNSKLYQRLLDCLENLKSQEYTRKDLSS